MAETTSSVTPEQISGFYKTFLGAVYASEDSISEQQAPLWAISQYLKNPSSLPSSEMLEGLNNYVRLVLLNCLQILSGEAVVRELSTNPEDFKTGGTTREAIAIYIFMHMGNNLVDPYLLETKVQSSGDIWLAINLTVSKLRRLLAQMEPFLEASGQNV